MTNNVRQMRDVILCKDCGLRKTEGCPMFEWAAKMGDASYELNVRDKTVDYGFCHMSAPKEDKEK